MKLLLDTHAFVWWMLDDPRLSTNARAAIEANEASTFVSIGSIWEISIKVGVGKWPEAIVLLDEAENAALDEGFALLAITVAHVRAAGLMSLAHRDPFDRLLAAQAHAGGMTLITSDGRMGGLGAPVLW